MRTTAVLAGLVFLFLGVQGFIMQKMLLPRTQLILEGGFARGTGFLYLTLGMVLVFSAFFIKYEK